MKDKDEQIVRECLEGKPQAQRALYELLKVPMYMLCLRYASCQAEAQDFLQDGFVKVFRDLHQFDSAKGSLKGWVRKIFLNTAFQALRAKKDIFSGLDVDIAANLHMSDETITADLSAKELTALIQTLPEGYRLVFNLYVVEGYTHKEIGGLLQISANTSKSQLFKAKALLRKRLKVANPAISEQYGKKIRQK